MNLAKKMINLIGQLRPIKPCPIREKYGHYTCTKCIFLVTSTNCVLGVMIYKDKNYDKHFGGIK